MRTSFRSLFSTLSVAILLASQVSCTSKKKKTEAPQDSAKVPTEFVVPAQHREAMQADLKLSLFKSIRFALSESATTESISDAQLFDAAALALANEASLRLTNEKSTSCLDGTSTNAFQDFMKCVLRESINSNFGTSDDALASMRAALKDNTQAILANVASVRFAVAQAHSKTIGQLLEILVRQDTFSKAIESLSQRTQSIHDAVLLIRDGSATNDAPWISAKFFEGRRFVLTNSLEQASVGIWMHAMNMSSQIVRLEVASDKFYIVREKSGLYEGTTSIDLILNSYPILDSRMVNGERYYQVNFANPDNKHFVLSQMGEGNPEADMTIDSIKVRVAHSEKAPLRELGNRSSPSSGLYFDAQDSNLVLDELVLVNTNMQLTDDSELPPALFEREALRPNIRLSQGLFVIEQSSEDFGKIQAREISEVMGELFSMGVKDGTEGKEETYFTGSFFTPPGAGFPRIIRNARKYNTEKPIEFVISGNTPAAAIPALKSSVDTYSRLFEKMSPAGKKSPRIVALTQAEFEEKNRTEGLRIGGDIVAADPRVNMIYWEDNPNIPAAWATTAANPKTGEVISADVMMSGVGWGLNGCYSYMLRTWASKPGPNNTNPVPFPVAAHHLMMQEGCRMVLLGMRLVGSSSAPVPVDNPNNPDIPLDPAALTAAVAAADTSALNTLFANALGKTLGKDKANLLLQRSNESDLEFAARLAALAEDSGNALKQKIAPPVYAANVPAMLKSISDVHPDSDISSTTVAARLGKNSLRAKVDCVLRPNLSNKLIIANSGVPGFSSAMVASPQDAALASIRGVLLHELGHTFGLRHNFIASTTQGEVESGDALPVPVASGSDSLMEYTDDGVLLDMSAKKDYQQPTASDAAPAFGVYDVLALSALYGLDASAYKMKTPTPFCTDGNKNLVANCVPFDFGKSSTEHMLYKANLAVQELRLARDMDLAYGAVAQQIMGRYQGLLGLFTSNMTSLWGVWGAYAQVAANSTRPAAQNAALNVVDKLFYAKGLESDYLTNSFFKDKTGRAPMGIWDFMHIRRSDLTVDPAKPQVISGMMVGMLRNAGTSAFVRAAPSIHAVGAQLQPDNLYLRGIRNVKMPDSQVNPKYAFRDMLIQDFGNKIMIPEGRAVENWEYFDSTGRKNGSQAMDASGNPVQVLLAKPLFNHRAQFATLSGVSVRSDEGMKDVIAMYSGNSDLQEMVISGIALTQIAPWGGSAGGSEAFERVIHDRAAIADQIKTGLISPNAIEPAKFIVGFFDTLLASGFPALQ